jgi:hypothetical protein
VPGELSWLRCGLAHSAIETAGKATCKLPRLAHSGVSICRLAQPTAY